MVSVYISTVRPGGCKLVLKHVFKQFDILVSPSHITMREATESRGVGSNTGNGVGEGRDTGDSVFHLVLPTNGRPRSAGDWPPNGSTMDC